MAILIAGLKCISDFEATIIKTNRVANTHTFIVSVLWRLSPEVKVCAGLCSL